MSDIFLDFILCAKDKFNNIINLSHGCLNSDCVMAMPRECFFLLWYLAMTLLIMNLLIMTMPVILDAAE
jgi:hypothetical protein